MKLYQALGYFLREAGVNLMRSWRISLLAVTTIAVSLFIGGAFLLVGQHLRGLVESWRSGAKVVVYLRNEASPQAAAAVVASARAEPWVRQVDLVTPQQARQRFEASFPSISGLVEGWQQEPLPTSIEIAFDPLRVEEPRLDHWIDLLRQRPEVSMVDDDRDWIGQLEAALRVITGLGLVLGGVLMAAAVFTIASVIRLTAHLYRQEIAIMRLVGATEFYIRGPFYVEGLLQGLLGGGIALAGLALARYIAARIRPEPLLSGILGGPFLAVALQLVLVLLGATAGLAGAIVSLRREELAL